MSVIEDMVSAAQASENAEVFVVSRGVFMQIAGSADSVRRWMGHRSVTLDRDRFPVAFMGVTLAQASPRADPELVELHYRDNSGQPQIAKIR